MTWEHAGQEGGCRREAGPRSFGCGLRMTHEGGWRLERVVDVTRSFDCAQDDRRELPAMRIATPCHSEAAGEESRSPRTDEGPGCCAETGRKGGEGSLDRAGWRLRIRVNPHDLEGRQRDSQAVEVLGCRSKSARLHQRRCCRRVVQAANSRRVASRKFQPDVL